jgi:tetratricopeptide (TPR) repeat protein
VRVALQTAVSARLAAGLALTLLAAATPASAQGKFPPESLKNLQALPEGTTVEQLVETMSGFTRALGVRCSYCHVGSAGQPLETYDFAADTKQAKKTARRMIRMVRVINTEHLERLDERALPSVTVTCATCHRGVTQPRPLSDEVMAAYRKGGAPAAAARYRELREDHYGDGAYDFGDVPLTVVADTLQAAGDVPGALTLLQLNVELVPTSYFGYWQLAEMQDVAGQTQAAIASLERAVALRPRPDLVERLAELRKKAANPKPEEPR